MSESKNPRSALSARLIIVFGIVGRSSALRFFRLCWVSSMDKVGTTGSR